MNISKGFYVEADYRDLNNPDFIKYTKNILAQQIGTEIIEKMNLDINNFIGNARLCVQISLMNKDNPFHNSKELKAVYKIEEVKEIERVYISRKDEVNTMSKFYTGDKLTWRERLQVLFKGRLYGGSLLIKDLGE